MKSIGNTNYILNTKYNKLLCEYLDLFKRLIFKQNNLFLGYATTEILCKGMEDRTRNVQ